MPAAAQQRIRSRRVFRGRYHYGRDPLVSDTLGVIKLGSAATASSAFSQDRSRHIGKRTGPYGIAAFRLCNPHTYGGEHFSGSAQPSRSRPPHV